MNLRRTHAQAQFFAVAADVEGLIFLNALAKKVKIRDTSASRQCGHPIIIIMRKKNNGDSA